MQAPCRDLAKIPLIELLHRDLARTPLLETLSRDIAQRSVVEATDDFRSFPAFPLAVRILTTYCLGSLAGIMSF